MSLTELGALGEFLGSLGVIVTLVYLALQIRRNTAATRTASVWAMTEQFNAGHVAVLQNRQLAETIAKARAGEPADAADKAQISSMVMLMVNGYAAAWDARSDGHFSDTLYTDLKRDALVLAERPFQQALATCLRDRDPAFVAEFFSDPIFGLGVSESRSD